jgi:hypothetical protein
VAPTVHRDVSVGFIDASSLPGTTSFSGEPVSLPATGVAYQLPALAELVASEQRLNPGRVVLGSASHDAIAGDTAVTTVGVPRTAAGSGEVYLDCIGPSNVTVTGANGTITSPCLSAGSYGGPVGAGTVTVTAAGDTSWRVVIYSP